MGIIKKETISESKVRCLLKSSNILESVYDTSKKELTLTFKNGRRYKYTGVLKELNSSFEQAESQGKFFYQYIKTLPTTRVEDADVGAILKEIAG